MIQFKN